MLNRKAKPSLFTKQFNQLLSYILSLAIWIQINFNVRSKCWNFRFNFHRALILISIEHNHRMKYFMRTYSFSIRFLAWSLNEKHVVHFFQLYERDTVTISNVKQRRINSGRMIKAVKRRLNMMTRSPWILAVQNRRTTLVKGNGEPWDTRKLCFQAWVLLSVNDIFSAIRIDRGNPKGQLDEKMK